MVPRLLKHKLAQLRGRERLLQLTWGGARWLALVLAVLFLACLIDYLVDRGGDTPMALRRLLFYSQLLVAAVAGFFLILWPLRKRLHDDNLALRVEEQNPQFEHRLISAVQLNKPGAFTQGMSAQLIAVVTKEAEEQAERVHFAQVADSRRLKWSAATLLPVLAIVVIPLLLWPRLGFTLLARQFLADADIPRNVTIETTADPVYPSGEKVKLTFKVRGKNLKDQAGEVVVSPKDQPRDRYALELEAETGPEEATFAVQLPASSVDFEYNAWLGDGRLRTPGSVRFEPRPVVKEQVAFVRLPDSFGKVLDVRRYELLQRLGDVVGIPGSSARVIIKIQKPVKKAVIELLGPEKIDPDRSPEDNGPEIVKGQIGMDLSRYENAKGETVYGAEGIFGLKEGVTGYRILLVDHYDFENIPRPRRSIRIVPEESPQVALLKEQFPSALFVTEQDSASDESVVEGLPVLVDQSIPIAYAASGQYGLGQARLLFRVLKKVESGNDAVAEEKWNVLPLPEVTATAASGPFDLRRGMFKNSPFKDQIFFHALPDEIPLPRTLGGGRFDFKTTGIADGKGGLLNLKVGDQVEYRVEVISLSGNKSGQSESRVKTIVNLEELDRWFRENSQEYQRLQALDKKQRGVFEIKN